MRALSSVGGTQVVEEERGRKKRKAYYEVGSSWSLLFRFLADCSRLHQTPILCHFVRCGFVACTLHRLIVIISFQARSLDQPFIIRFTAFCFTSGLSPALLSYHTPPPGPLQDNQTPNNNTNLNLQNPPFPLHPTSRRRFRHHHRHLRRQLHLHGCRDAIATALKATAALPIGLLAVRPAVELPLHEDEAREAQDGGHGHGEDGGGGLCMFHF